MCWNNTFARIFLGIAALLVATVENAQALTPTTVTLSGSTSPVGTSATSTTANAHGAYISTATLTTAQNSAPLIFDVALKMRNLTELQTRVGRGERIPPQEMADKYEPSAADYQKVVAWLQGEGFTIIRQDPRHMVVFAQGKISQVASSLKVNFARVSMNDKEYTSAVTAPSVPSYLSPLLVGINGLQPHLHAHKHLVKPDAQPAATTGTVSYVPNQIATAYGATALYNKNISGAGQTIAILIDTFPSTSDLLLFWKNCSVNQSISNIQFIQAVPGALPTASSGDGEETLDVEWASAMAPGAHVRVYGTVSLDDPELDMGYQQILDDVTQHPEYGIHQMSMSFGEGETYIEATGGGPNSATVTAENYFLQLANAGVTVFASTGDSGATPGPGGTGDESGPVQVEYPSSDVNVVAVGGTTLTLFGNNTTNTESVWNNSSGATGGGISVFFARPAWQVGPGVLTGSKRQLPDVSAPGDPNFGATIYFTGTKSTVGGTSWASPMWAGFCALINQARINGGLKPLGTAPGSGTTETLVTDLYPLLSSNYAANFNDIVSGTNATSRSGGLYSAANTAGFDCASGIGTPHLGVLAQTLIGAATLAGVSMPLASQATTPGQNATFTVAVGGSSATYQWQRKPIGSTTWTNLSDGGAYSGSSTASLTVTTATPGMSGDQFQCVMTLSGNIPVTSTPSALIVDSPMIISTLAGAVGVSALANGTATAANFAVPSGVAIDGSGNLFIADYSNNAIREVTPGGVVTTPYGSSAGLSTPNGVAFDAQGDLYVADTGNNLIRKISGGTLSTFSSGTFSGPEGVAVDSSGNVYVADTGFNIIRKITAAGVVSTLAGVKGSAGYLDGAATNHALFNGPAAVAVDGAGNVYVADFGNCVVRKISGGVVSTVGGQGTVSGYVDGPAATSLFNAPTGVTVDAAGNLYVTDCLVPPLSGNAAGNDLVRKISPAGVVSTLAGQAGTVGSANGTGTVASFYSLQAVALNPSTGTFYFCDTYNQTIRAGTILAPVTLSITATQPLAQVFGAVAGVFTVTRIGGDPSASVTANYTVGGTAVEGQDYTPALPLTLTIPVGETSETITINPVENDSATVNPTLQLTLNTSPNYALGSATSATVTIREITPFQTWTSGQFGANATVPSIAGETADPNNNGVPNLLEYAFGANPTQTGTEPLPTVVTALGTDNQEHLEITFNQLTGTSGLTYTVQVSSDLVTWSSGSGFTTLVSQTPNGSGLSQVTVMDNTPVPTLGKRFIRLQVGESQ